MDNVSVATAKKNLSEYISKVEIKGNPITISRRGKPVVAIVSIEDLEYLNSKAETGGLSDAIGKWEKFGEIEKDVNKVFAYRRTDGERKVSL